WEWSTNLKGETTKNQQPKPEVYSSKQERCFPQFCAPTCRSSGPTSAIVRLHQQWPMRSSSSRDALNTSSCSAGMYIFFVRRFLQKFGFMALRGWSLGGELGEGAPDQRADDWHLVSVVRLHV